MNNGPCQEVIVEGDDVDLSTLPVPIWTPEKDAGPYLTPLWITKDPDSGRRNIGIRRCQVKSKNTTGILFGAPDRGGAIHHQKYKERGEHMPRPSLSVVTRSNTLLPQRVMGLMNLQLPVVSAAKRSRW